MIRAIARLLIVGLISKERDDDDKTNHYVFNDPKTALAEYAATSDSAGTIPPDRAVSACH